MRAKHIFKKFIIVSLSMGMLYSCGKDNTTGGVGGNGVAGYNPITSNSNVSRCGTQDTNFLSNFYQRVANNEQGQWPAGASSAIFINNNQQEIIQQNTYSFEERRNNVLSILNDARDCQAVSYDRVWILDGSGSAIGIAIDYPMVINPIQVINSSGQTIRVFQTFQGNSQYQYNYNKTFNF